MKNNCLKYTQLVNKLYRKFSECKQELFYQEERENMLHHKLEKNKAENYVLNDIKNDTKNFIKKIFSDYGFNEF